MVESDMFTLMGKYDMVNLLMNECTGFTTFTGCCEGPPDSGVLSLTLPFFQLGNPVEASV